MKQILMFKKENPSMTQIIVGHISIYKTVDIYNI